MDSYSTISSMTKRKMKKKQCLSQHCLLSDHPTLPDTVLILNVENTFLCKESAKLNKSLGRGIVVLIVVTTVVTESINCILVTKF
jgi:hypothetical protein